MSEPAKWTWLGLKFEIHEYEPLSNWREVPVVYIFAGRDAEEGWTALYIGETGNVRERLAGHDEWPKAVSLGATHVHALLAPASAQSRRDLERELRLEYNPPLNG